MKRLSTAFPLVVASAFLFLPPGCESEQKSAPPATPAATPEPARPLTVRDSAIVRTSARVNAIDHASRTVTLEDASGRTVRLVVSNDVRRLDEVRPGDQVIAEYEVSLLAELRPPTAAEAAAPVAYVEVADIAGKESTPGAAVGRGARVVTTVAAVDQPAMLVTLRGPGGDTITVQGRRPENVARLKVGDTIVITFTETVAVGIERHSAK